MNPDFHDNWPDARRRFTDLWNRRPVSTPHIGIDVVVPQPDSAEFSIPPDLTPEEFWFDPDFVAAKFTAEVKGLRCYGTTIPGETLLANWLCAPMGGSPGFDFRTIWLNVDSEVDYSRPSPFRHHPDDLWHQKFERVYLAVLEAARRVGFCQSPSGGLPMNDLLSMTMGAENFLMALMDHPEWMREAIEAGARDKLAVFRRSLEQAKQHIGEDAYCVTGWMRQWAPEPFVVLQSDVSCMMPPAMFEEFVLPELEIFGNEYPVWYHLDGRDAQQHLPILLSLDYIRVIQYVPTPAEAPNGIGQLELYRKIQAAGKIVHIAVAPERITGEFLAALDPSLLLINTGCANIAEAEKLLAKVCRGIL